jgi:hypothetical protein
MEIEGTATFLFANHYEYGTLEDMYDFWIHAHNVEVFTFRDLSGTDYDVQVAGTPAATRLEDLPHRSIYMCEVLLLRTGFIR